ncbi:hypothetical protein KGQ64_06735 [bacterium]|nr:hypothetical protein [bacterium]
MNRKIFFFGTASLLLAAGAAQAKDVTLRPFTNPVVSSTVPFVDCTSSGALKGGGGKYGTQVQIQFKKLNMPDTDGIPCTADDVICLQQTTSTVGAASLATEILFRAEVKKGQIKIKHDMCAENSGLCPGAIGVTPSYAERVACYAADPSFNPGIVYALQPNACEGLVLSQVTPGSALIAETGSTSGCP